MAEWETWSGDCLALSPARRVDVLAGMQRDQARLDAARVRLLAVIETHPAETGPAVDLDKHWDREEVACVLKVASVSARARMLHAVELVDRYPATLALLETGAITLWHALRLVEAGIGQPDAVMAEVEATVLGKAPLQSVAQFKASVTRALAHAAPQSQEVKLAEARGQRRVVFTPQPDGTSDLWACGLAAADAAAMADRIHQLATGWKATDKGTGDERTGDQRQADALVALVLGAGDPDQASLKPVVNVVVALSTLLDLDEQPGELDGHGPIPASVVRALAEDPTGTWRRLLTDPNGQLIDITADTYTPPATMQRLIRHRQPRCSFPSCRRRAATCETDHIQPWAEGGPTSPANLQPLCARHHHLKHETGWHLHRNPDLTTTWTSPTSHTYPRPPDDHLPKDTTNEGDTCGDGTTDEANPAA